MLADWHEHPAWLVQPASVSTNVVGRAEHAIDREAGVIAEGLTWSL